MMINRFLVPLFDIEYEFRFQKHKEDDQIYYHGVVYNTPDGEDLSEGVMYVFKFSRIGNSWSQTSGVEISNINDFGFLPAKENTGYDIQKAVAKVFAQMFVEGIKSWELLDGKAYELLLAADLITERKAG